MAIGEARRNVEPQSINCVRKSVSPLLALAVCFRDESPKMDFLLVLNSCFLSFPYEEALNLDIPHLLLGIYN